MSKIFIQYFDSCGDKITLLFRNEKSLNEHLINNKILKSNLIYKSDVKPKNPDLVGSLL